MIISYAAIMISSIHRYAHSKSKGETPSLHPNICCRPPHPHPLMLLSLFQLSLFAVTFPLALSLEIILPDSTPIAPQSTQISLLWMSRDPQEFNLGVYWAKWGATTVLPDHSSGVGVNQVVTNFTQDQNVTMTFNHMSYADVKDHIVMAWVTRPYDVLVYSHWFTVDGSNTTDTGFGGGTIPSSTGSSAPVAQSPASTATTEEPTATLAAIKTTSHTGAIVGGVLGSLALLSIISGLVLFMLRRRRRSRNSAPSRAFWKYLDEKKGPPSSEPLRYPSPTYSPGVQAHPLSLRSENYYYRMK
ncbi:hypothetical protein EV421DRAFT_1272220 [Armillaria borealis]|uniref:Uncharacterized protein n=1 Tax=Armillaria borealis TaxID=47425 RepID=A0AA39MHE1_9AGAR|nr:hypothetical protein EV421DRAFT_1272220 [Armillaria borealis]